MSVRRLRIRRRRGEKLVMVTAYDWSFARLIAQTDVDAILVGDSAAMVMHGFAATPSVPLDAMIYHVASVARGAPEKFIIADIPFGWAHRSRDSFMDAVMKLVSAGAHALKVEGTGIQNESIALALDAGIPVMGHIGLTPQHVHRLGGHRVQGKSEGAIETLVHEAKQLEDIGCFGCVLECVIPAAAQAIQAALESMITIGIGAGSETDGQILVMHDLLGLNQEHQPRFVRRFGEIGQATTDAVSSYIDAVRDVSYPSPEETYAS